MKVVVKKWGNSASVRIPASVMAAAALSLNQAVDVREEAGRIVIEPIREETFDLDDLVAGITDENRLDPAIYNGKTGLMVCCPLTTRIKGYPFEVALASQPGSAVLSDQVKNLDWRARRATRKGRVTDQELRRIKGKLRTLIG